MMTIIFATLPGLNVMWLQDRYDSALFFAGTEGHDLYVAPADESLAKQLNQKMYP